MDVQTKRRIEFLPLKLSDRAAYQKALADESERGCEYSFANLYLWGRQSMATLDGHTVFFSQFDRRSVYPYPLGKGNEKAVLDAIIEDASARGIPCRLTGLSEENREILERLYPDRFRFHSDEGSFDYVYDINDLAELAGKKYHPKRTHLNRFRESFPDARVEWICEQNKGVALSMIEEWYAARLQENPNADYHMEEAAIRRALRDFEALEMDGLILLGGGKVLAVTMGSHLREDTFDVQFEKARPDATGAYAAVNYEFARALRAKYPRLAFLNREEDMGIEGLRRAKRSYYPHHQVKKYWAHLLEDGYDY